MFWPRLVGPARWNSESSPRHVRNEGGHAAQISPLRIVPGRDLYHTMRSRTAKAVEKILCRHSLRLKLLDRPGGRAQRDAIIDRLDQAGRNGGVAPKQVSAPHDDPRDLPRCLGEVDRFDIAHPPA